MEEYHDGFVLRREGISFPSSERAWPRMVGTGRWPVGRGGPPRPFSCARTVAAVAARTVAAVYDRRWWVPRAIPSPLPPILDPPVLPSSAFAPFASSRSPFSADLNYRKTMPDFSHALHSTPNLRSPDSPRSRNPSRSPSPNEIFRIRKKCKSNVGQNHFKQL